MMIGKRSRGVRTLAVLGALALTTLAGPAPTFAAGNDAATTVWQVGGSNMGECSAYLGQMQVRDDVNQIIRQYGDYLGIDNPGQLFHVRAQQEVNLPPAQECLKRTLPN